MNLRNCLGKTQRNTTDTGRLVIKSSKVKDQKFGIPNIVTKEHKEIRKVLLNNDVARNIFELCKDKFYQINHFI